MMDFEKFFVKWCLCEIVNNHPIFKDDCLQFENINDISNRDFILSGEQISWVVTLFRSTNNFLRYR